MSEGGILSGEFHVTDVDLESIRLMREDQITQSADWNSAGETVSGVTNPIDWLSVKLDGDPLPLVLEAPRHEHKDGRPHTVIPFHAGAAIGEAMVFQLVDFFTFDPQHRVVISLEKNGETKVGLLTTDSTEWIVSLNAPSAYSQFIKFTWEGVWHIWIGIDHILFLIALILPSVLLYRDGDWIPVAGFKEAFYAVIKIVTSFTIAHSITLSLAALDIVSLPSKWVESLIAFSVALAALNNLYPMVRDRIWTVTFGFGLVHGFGFANVLSDLELPASALAIALLSFNVGVEIGQVAILLCFFPVIFILRSHALYLPVKLRFGSAVIALVACGWMVDRVFEIGFMPF